ncbi:MAG: hypothetical protein K5872_06630 [Rhizobiaceae bacterium]|nr:hypothetical protein [Rhizobiaceae bacterium]MCV0405888.1 hypothetical protein [Rhizobiaceae bacterium]
MTFGRIAAIGLVGLAICWLPLFIVGGLGISNNPIGLGLLAVVGTPVVAALVAGLLVYKMVRLLVR